jgi:hypothetical protein
MIEMHWYLLACAILICVGVFGSIEVRMPLLQLYN